MKILTIILIIILGFTIWACNSIDKATGLTTEQLRKINS